MLEYRLTQPFAHACLSLLSPWRVRGATYVVDDNDPLRPALDGVWSQRAPATREAGLVLLTLLDVPDPRAWAAARPLAVHVLSEFRPEWTTLWQIESATTQRRLVECQLTCVGDETLPPHAVIADRKQSHPLAAMHLLSAQTRRVADTITEEKAPTLAWRTYALACHRAYRRVEAFYVNYGFPPAASAEQMYDAALSLRYLLQSLVIVRGTRAADPTQAEIRLAMDNLRQRWPIEQHPEWPKSVRAHERNIEQALEGAWRRRVRPGLRQRAAPQPQEVPPAALIVTERVWNGAGEVPLPAGGRCVTRYVGVPADLADTGECADDYGADHAEVPSVPLVDPRLARMMALRAAQRLHRDALLFPFDREYLQLHDYARLYGRLLGDPIERLAVEEQGSAVLLLLALHVGISPDGDTGSGLLATQVRCGGSSREPATNALDETTSHPSAITLDLDTFVLEFPVPPNSSGYATVPMRTSDPLARPTQRTVSLPLPPFLRPPMERYLQSRDAWLRAVEHEHHPRLFLRGSDPPCPLTLTDVVAFLRRRGESSAERLVRKLIRSFFPLYVTRLGLDPIVACYVSGRAPRIFATQLFYCRLSADRLVSEYWRKAAQADRLIRRAAAALDIRLVDAGHSSVSRPSMAGGYGSRVVPRWETIPGFGAAVRAELRRHESQRQEAEGIVYHNLYSAYAWTLAQLASGARPTKEGGVTRAVGTPHPTRLRLDDKQSSRHLEWRTQRRSTILDALRRELGKARQEARLLPSFDHTIDADLGAPLLFLLRWNGQPYLPTHRDIASVLQLFPDVAATFPFPANVGRHLIETELTDAGADRASQDYSLGHQRRWREAPNRFSAADLLFIEDHFAAQVDRLTHRLDLQVIRYREGAPS